VPIRGHIFVALIALYGGWRLISWPWRRYQEHKRAAELGQILNDPED
jgi:hypothetical protein